MHCSSFLHHLGFSFWNAAHLLGPRFHFQPQVPLPTFPPRSDIRVLWRRIEKDARNLLKKVDEIEGVGKTNEEHPAFPLFSQKSAAGSQLQVKAEKPLAEVSTDSQGSSQQQGFIRCSFRISFLQKKLWLWILERGRNLESDSVLRRTRRYFHSAARESGFILFEKASRVPA